MIENKQATVVLTTINSPNPKIGKWAEVSGNKVIVVGDNKTPCEWNHKDCDFISIEDQKKVFLKFPKVFLKITTPEKTSVIFMLSKMVHP